MATWEQFLSSAAQGLSDFTASAFKSKGGALGLVSEQAGLSKPMIAYSTSGDGQQGTSASVPPPTPGGLVGGYQETVRSLLACITELAPQMQKITDEGTKLGKNGVGEGTDIWPGDLGVFARVSTPAVAIQQSVGAVMQIGSNT